MAASQQGVVATGADYDNATRRRNVPSTSANGGSVNRVELDEKKTQVKKVSYPKPWGSGAHYKDGG
jgi:dolichyl-phosphate-mannose-protein mannosyltransferase